MFGYFKGQCFDLIFNSALTTSNRVPIQYVDTCSSRKTQTVTSALILMETSNALIAAWIIDPLSASASGFDFCNAIRLSAVLIGDISTISAEFYSHISIENTFTHFISLLFGLKFSCTFQHHSYTGAHIMRSKSMHWMTNKRRSNHMGIQHWFESVLFAGFGCFP